MNLHFGQNDFCIACGQDFLDIQGRYSYSSTVQKQGLIKEQIWNVLSCNCFANRVADPLNVTTEQAELGLAEMAANRSVTRQLTNWTWMSNIFKT
jgi:hypothetical protein